MSKIRTRREALGLMQREVAERAGRTRPWLSSLETGRTSLLGVPLGQALTLANTLRAPGETMWRALRRLTEAVKDSAT